MFKRTVSCLVIALAGCADGDIGENTSPLVMRLDNLGGENHGGRRIELHQDGTFRNEWYSDVVEYDRDYDEAYGGTYTLDADRTQLTLTPDVDQPESTPYTEDDAPETLFRVEVGSVEYWVADEVRERIKDPAEVTLQDESLQKVTGSGGP